MKRTHFGLLAAVASVLGTAFQPLPRAQQEHRPHGNTAEPRTQTRFIRPTNVKANARRWRQLHQPWRHLSWPSPRKRPHIKPVGIVRHCAHPIEHERTRYRRGKVPKFYCGLCRAVT